MKFKDLGICTPILKVLEEQRYEIPTPIQEKTIPYAIEGKDILGLAQTGTGKTAAFAVPTLQFLAENHQNPKKRKIRTLVLTPTRELAVQVYESFKVYGKYLPLRSTVVFGGVGQGRQVNALKKGVDILIATPGRLTDLINQGYIDLKDIEVFILDEADHMLDMGFIDEIRHIIKMLPAKKQTMLFSATMPKEMTPIVEKLLVDPVEVSVAPVSSTADKIDQIVCFVDQKNKIEVMADFIKENPHSSILVFARTKRSSDKIVKELSKRKIKAEAIHGDKSQRARQAALENFKRGKVNVLVATDIASRGIDISELNYVINHDLPEVPETYVHRIGRTARAGSEGTAISLCSFQEIYMLRDIERLTKQEIKIVENDKYPMVDETPKSRSRKSRNFSRNRKPKDKEENNQNNKKDKKQKQATKG